LKRHCSGLSVALRRSLLYYETGPQPRSSQLASGQLVVYGRQCPVHCSVPGGSRATRNLGDAMPACEDSLRRHWRHDHLLHCSITPLFDRIAFDPAVMRGRACVRRTRISDALAVNLAPNRMSTVDIIPPVPAKRLRAPERGDKPPRRPCASSWPTLRRANHRGSSSATRDSSVFPIPG
jgi:hypothetical protein